MFEVRRGCENLRELKKSDFQEVDDQTWNFKFIKKVFQDLIFWNRSRLFYLFQVISEQDKNHKRGLWWFEFDQLFMINIWFTQEPTEMRRALSPFWTSQTHSTLVSYLVNTSNISLSVGPLLLNLVASSSPGPNCPVRCLTSTTKTPWFSSSLICQVWEKFTFQSLYFSFLVGKNEISAMLPSLCKAVDKPKCTNHQIRLKLSVILFFYSINLGSLP